MPNRQRFTPAGSPRVLGLVAPYTGKEIAESTTLLLEICLARRIATLFISCELSLDVAIETIFKTI